MSYQYASYGPPYELQGSGYPQQRQGGPPPPQGQYYQQAPQGYGAPPPPPPAGQYYQQPPQSYGPPQGYGQGYGQPQSQGYGQPGPPPAPPQNFGSYPPQGYGTPPPPPGQYGQAYGQAAQQYPPTPPSLGYGPPQAIQWSGDPDADALRRAMKGFGTDNKALIHVLSTKDPLQIAMIRDAFARVHNRNLEHDIKSETSGWFETGLVALARGPLQHDVYLLHEAMSGIGTKEHVLNDVLLGRSNADMMAIKNAYHQTFRRRLEDVVKGDLSFKTERHFMIALSAARAEDSAPVVRAELDRDVNELYDATEGRIGTDEMKVCSILSTRNDNQIRAIAHEYQQKYARSLDHVIRKEFHGHMEDALLYQLHHACDKYMHQAQLLEDAMAGLGTTDHLLVSRVVRAHWDRNNMANVCGAYEKRFHKSLAHRIKGETSGNYEALMLACIGANV